MRCALFVLLVLGLVAQEASARRPTRRACREACADAVAECLAQAPEAGARYCRRSRVTRCRRHGFAACEVTTTTVAMTTTTSAIVESSTTEHVTTTTTLFFPTTTTLVRQLDIVPLAYKLYPAAPSACGAVVAVLLDYSSQNVGVGVTTDVHGTPGLGLLVSTFGVITCQSGAVAPTAEVRSDFYQSTFPFFTTDPMSVELCGDALSVPSTGHRQCTIFAAADPESSNAEFWFYGFGCVVQHRIFGDVAFPERAECR